MSTEFTQSNENELALLAKTVRILAAEAVEKANSGHPGMPMGAADYAVLLWSDYLRFNPKEPNWSGRDKFVLSAGHGSMLLYSLLHLFGYDLPLSELQRFRQWESKTPGHPEYGVTSGVETTTGPLGQGLANGVGLALSEKLLADRYCSSLFGNRVYGIVSDGDLMEGVASEAASLAGHLQLGNLIYLYDDNHISIGGRTDICFTESVPKRFEAYGWHVQRCDGHNFSDIRKCMEAAIHETGAPSIICARTMIGLGSPGKQDTSEVHGAPLGSEELRKTKAALGWEYEGSFVIPSEVASFCKARCESKLSEYKKWMDEFHSWEKAEAEKAKQFHQQRERAIPSE
ncbi:MAG: transketolase, partial [Bdellovibrionales bacterium]|nr:transketolase [Bdellovibrionales bacterium]